ncbi:MAG: hypothetical protein ACRENG_21060 [bacterium]
MVRCFTLLLLVVFSSITAWRSLKAQTPDSTRVNQLEKEMETLRSDLEDLKSDLRDKGEQGFVLFLFGGFCALWAQNTRRNPWLWFFLGALFNIITVIVLLNKNSNDGKTATLRGS